MPRDNMPPPSAPPQRGQPGGPPPIDRSNEKSGAGYAAAIAAACLVCAPLTARFEGKRNAPYLDPVKIPTVCYGETQVEMRVYSDDECGRMLRVALAKRYAPQLLAPACLPQLARPERRHEFAAMIDAAYNAGPAAVCSSRMAVQFRAGNWSAGCAALEGWYVTARDRRTGARRQLPGLVRRRLAEKQLCLSPELPIVKAAASKTPRAAVDMLMAPCPLTPRNLPQVQERPV